MNSRNKPKLQRIVKRVLAYISRRWEDEPEPPHPQLKILPPFILEIIAYLIGLAILYQIWLRFVIHYG